jgi:hypothetical protein
VYFETARKLYHGPSRDDHAWISARCKHCNKEKVQKKKATYTPITSRYPGQRMVLDLMDFRVSSSKSCALLLFILPLLWPN